MHAQLNVRNLLAGLTACLCLAAAACSARAEAPALLDVSRLQSYVETFNAQDNELYSNAIPNTRVLEFLTANVPRLDCPDRDIERTYYFRWWTYRKHLKQTPDGWVVTEFLPQVNWSGKYNTINCAAGHHFYEGRWLADPKYLTDYAEFWFRKSGRVRAYSFWAADSIYAMYLVQKNAALVTNLLDDLVKNYQAWEASHQATDGLFWQIDDRDGMEASIGKSGERATINSYMYGDARAVARIATLAGRTGLAAEYETKAATLRSLVERRLWNPQAKFFETLPRSDQELRRPQKAYNTTSPLGNDTRGEATSNAWVDVRELHGFTPWYFNLPEPSHGYEVAWKQLMDPKGFFAPYGPATAEQRHPGFKLAYTGHECQWNGPSWPYSTAVTLTALANVLNNYPQNAITRADYLECLRLYARSQQRTLPDGTVVPWIDENLNPLTGDWISRTMLLADAERRQKAGKPAGLVERGKDYNHSTFCDLVITGLIGLRPRADDTIEVNPLVPDGLWDYFCLDAVRYHGRTLTILWDKTGKRYGKGQGLRVLADGREIARSQTLCRLTSPGSAGAPAGALKR